MGILRNNSISQHQQEQLIIDALERVAESERRRVISGDEQTIRQTIYGRLMKAAEQGNQETVLRGEFLIRIAGLIRQGKEDEL